MEELAIPQEELDKKMELEYKIVSCTFMGLFYGELIEKFAFNKNAEMVKMLQHNMQLTQKLAVRYNVKYQKHLDMLGIKQDSAFNSKSN
jgi:hypothetical protein